MASQVDFIECTSMNVSYDVMGLATLSFSVVHNYPSLSFLDNYNTINLGGQTFRGYILDATMNYITNTEGWYETSVTLLATTN